MARTVLLILSKVTPSKVESTAATPDTAQLPALPSAEATAYPNYERDWPIFTIQAGRIGRPQALARDSMATHPTTTGGWEGFHQTSEQGTKR